VKDKLKKSKTIVGKNDDYQSHLEEFLNLQALIVHSSGKQEISSYLFEKQSQLRKNLTKKKLDDKELEEICLAKEELTKLEIKKSILMSDNSQQEYQSQIQVPPQVPSKK
jgi:hypothetical protein